MAEILLSLTIIGVVAAITLPSLTGNINERTWNTQRKALYARFSQALMLMPALNGYGTLTEDADGNVTEDTVAETFITAGLSKVMKMNNICSNDNLKDCGIPFEMTTLGAVQIDTPTTMKELNSYMVGSYSTAVDHISLMDTKAAAFETGNGESIIVYYNPVCVGSLNETGNGIGGVYIANKVCANFVYDLNGTKGPNTVGKDIGFITAIWPSDIKVVAPIPAVNELGDKYKIVDASKACTTFDSEYRLPNADEMISMLVNSNLIKNSTNSPGNAVKGYWTSTKQHRGNYWWYGIGNILDDYGSSTSLNVWCIKR